MGKFILSRVNERATRSKGGIIGYGLAFFFIAKAILIAATIACTAVYMRNGIDVQSLMVFGGDPDVVLARYGKWLAIFMVAIYAPLTEEVAFRLGLSFKRLHAALSIAFLMQLIISFFTGTDMCGRAISWGTALTVGCLLYFATKEDIWKRLGEKFRIPVIYVMAIAFGLIHFAAMDSITLIALPFMFLTVLQPMVAGFVASYYRVNLGFWWGVGIHILNNVPGIIMIAFS